MASCPEFSLPILEIRGLTGVCFVGGREKKSHPHEGGSKLQCNQEPLCPPPHLCVFHSLCLEGSSSTESSRQTPLMHQEPMPSTGTIPCISSTGFHANYSYGSHWCRWKGCHSDMHGEQSPCKVSFFHLLHKMLKSQCLQGMCTKNLQPGSKLCISKSLTEALASCPLVAPELADPRRQVVFSGWQASSREPVLSLSWIQVRSIWATRSTKPSPNKRWCWREGSWDHLGPRQRCSTSPPLILFPLLRSAFANARFIWFAITLLQLQISTRPYTATNCKVKVTRTGTQSCQKEGACPFRASRKVIKALSVTKNHWPFPAVTLTAPLPLCSVFPSLRLKLLLRELNTFAI